MPPDDRLADLADLALAVSRHLALQGHRDPAVVPLTQVEGFVLRHVDRHPGSSPGAVAAALGLHRSNLSATLRTLEDKGMVVGEHDPADRRTVRLQVTEAARESIARLRARSAQALAGLDVDDKALDHTIAVLHAATTLLEHGAGTPA